MSKVITFSRYFQKSHPRAGEPTGFVEKLWNSFNANYAGHTFFMDYEHEIKHELNPKVDYFTLVEFFRNLMPREGLAPKLHTIRAGNRFKVGDKFSPRVWSGKPYASKQIVIAPDLEVKKIYEIEIYETHEIFIRGGQNASFASSYANTIARNDGLELADFYNWFTKLPFKGQIICWSNDVNY